MQSNRFNNIIPLRAGKYLLLLFAAFLSIKAGAQTTYDSTTTYFDTAVVEEAPPPPEVEESTSQEQSGNFFKQRSGYDSLSVTERHISDSVLKKLREDKAFWYASEQLKNKRIKYTPVQNAPPNKKEQEVQKDEDDSDVYVPITKRSWFQTLLLVLIVAAVAGAVMWYLASSNIGLFRKKAKPIAAAPGEEEEMPEDIFAINYQKEIDKAAAQGNYRLAIRLMFLRLLKDMAERNVIRYKQDKTNFDYLLELHPTGYYKDFFRITRNYEYSWYGKFDVSEDAYKLIRTDFDQFEKRLG